MRLLLVEDDELLGDGLKAGLGQAGHSVEWLKDGASAEHVIQDSQFNVIVLDPGIPLRSGLDVLQEMRRRGNLIPVLGIEPGKRARVLDRLYRGLANHQSGCGLGLAIGQQSAR